MKRKVIGALLILTIVFSNSATAFAIDFTQWDTRSPRPVDILASRYFTSVDFLMNRGIVTGDPDGLFRPDRSITRAELAVMMARATLNRGQILDAEFNETFNDLMGFVWARPYINAAAESGILRGRGPGTFAPAGTVTYAEAITAIIRIRPGAGDAAEGMAPTWPENFIMYAQTYNLIHSWVVINDWNAPARRGDIAILLHHALPGTR